MLNLFNKKKRKLNYKLFKATNKKNRFIYYPPVNQEWDNSVYMYNKNYNTNIPVLDIIVNNLIKSYFSLQLNIKEKIKIIRKKLHKSTNRILISKAELKHTNDKVIITLFTYNRHKSYIFRIIKKIYIKIKKKYNLSKKYKLNTHILIKLSKFNENADFENPGIFSMLSAFDEKKKIKKIIITKLKIIIKLYKIVYYLNNLKKKKIRDKSLKKYKLHLNTKNYYNKYLKKVLNMENLLLNFNKIYKLNNYKFKDFFLFGLKNLIGKIYNKKIEFRIINLKKLHLNSDILLKTLTIKLKNRRNRLLKVLRKTLKLVKLPKDNKYLYYLYQHKINSIFLENCNVINLNLMYNLEKNKDILHKFLNKAYSDNENYNYQINIDNIKKNVFNIIKHKFIRGVRLEAGGRLTKRLTASRSISKFRYKGSIKNMDSSFEGLSTVNLKGYVRSNIQFTSLNSKTRNGSFGLKGWVSSY